MKKTILLLFFTLSGYLHCIGQVNVSSPAASEFVRYERIPVSYFNGLPNIEIPLYTIDTKDINLPISLSYHASGIKVNQYPTFVGLGWNLNAGGAIVRVINGQPDETCEQDLTDMTGIGYGGEHDPGYYFSSQYLDREDWASEQRLIDYANSNAVFGLGYDLQPDEFVINACGISGSVYFSRDNAGKIKADVRSGNGESFRVEPPVVIDRPDEMEFPGGSSGEGLKSYRIYKLFYEFTVIKNDGTRLIFGGDNDCIEFYTEKRSRNSTSPYQYMKTLPSAWMLREIISPNGNRIEFEYQRDGNPIVISDVRSDVWVYSPDGSQFIPPSQDPERGKSFVVLHPLYPEFIRSDNGLVIVFSVSSDNDLSTIRDKDENFIRYDGFSDHISDDVCYDGGGLQSRHYAPHNYSKKLTWIQIAEGNNALGSIGFSYIDNPDERLKLDAVALRGADGHTEQRYRFEYDARRLPPYNSTLTDNWGYWNNKDYRKADIENDFFGYRSANVAFAKAESLTGIVYPSGGRINLEYESNDYSKVATQIPDFKVMEKSGTAGGLRIRSMTYNTDTTSYTHSFDYKNDDGTSSGILSGIPVYVAEGGNHLSYSFSSWQNLVHFSTQGDIRQRYKMLSETYINMLGLTTGNHVTYSRILEYIGDEEPLVKEYRYTNHDSCPDTSDFSMYTNIDNVSLDNKFTSRAATRGLLTDEIWYSSGRKVKEVSFRYKTGHPMTEPYVRSVDAFSIPGLPGHLVSWPFVRYAPYKILLSYPSLESRSETLYDPSGTEAISTVSESYRYNSNLLLQKKMRKDSKGEVITTDISYPDEFSGGVFDEMRDRWIISSSVETVVCKDGKVTDGILTEYKSDKGCIVPYKTWRLDLEDAIDSTGFTRYGVTYLDRRYRLVNEIIESDNHGNPCLIRDDSGTYQSYEWGYYSSYPTAAVANAANTYRTYTVKTPKREHCTVSLNPEQLNQNVKTYTFNSYIDGDVTINLSGELGYDWFVVGRFDGKQFDLVQMRSDKPLTAPWDTYYYTFDYNVKFSNVPAGSHKISISNSVVRKGSDDGNRNGSLWYEYESYTSHVENEGQDEFLYEDFEQRGNYPFGYHSDRCHVGPYSISLDGASDRKYILDYRVYRNGDWSYVRRNLDGRTCTIDEGIYPIDDVRVRPEDADIVTYTWYPFVGLRSQTDGTGATISYGYDTYGRLQAIYDNTGSIVRQYDYNYAGNSQQPFAYRYGNEELSMDFRSSKCCQAEGFLPIPITYTVPANKYFSFVSEADANRLAFDDIISNGQEFADLNGRCGEHVVVSVYNPTSETFTAQYMWGTNGNFQYMSYKIVPSLKVGATGDIKKDYQPTVLFIPRRNYRELHILDSEKNWIPFIIESGHIFYGKDSYPDTEDTYIITPES